MSSSDWSSDVCSSDLRPEASLSRDSPSRMCIMRLGIGTRLAIAETAIGSVGETTAARAKATASGMDGIIQLMNRPMPRRSEEHTSELQSLMRISYAVFRLKQKKTKSH